jgi:hypothetical protein
MLMTNKRPKWIGWKALGDEMIFWWLANTDPDIYNLTKDLPGESSSGYSHPQRSTASFPALERLRMAAYILSF